MSTHAAADLEFLLDRPIRRLLTPADRRAFAGRRVLITGAGGSIGSELARQIAACGPEQLVLLDQCELNLFQIERELQEAWPGVAVEPVLADVTRGSFVRRIFRSAEPDVVYHAAAYKHVTMAERAACAAALVNVFGTEQVLTAARECGARFVLISSDKAAAPTSVMGATKRVAELVVSRHATQAFRPVIVRFGNVLASSGSVVAIMRERIREGKPLQITNPDATRYFMTAGEAVSLVMKAELLGRGGETYWLDMGKQVRLGDLVDRILELEARNGHAPVPIEVVGLRAGEKLREQLTEQGVTMTRTRDPRIWVAAQLPISRASVVEGIKELRRSVASGDAGAALAAIARLVPEFSASTEALTEARAQSIAGARRMRPVVARSA